mgnify:CR=1 FL=1
MRFRILTRYFFQTQIRIQKRILKEKFKLYAVSQYVNRGTMVLIRG